jgi:hypothetical protein
VFCCGEAVHAGCGGPRPGQLVGGVAAGCVGRESGGSCQCARGLTLSLAADEASLDLTEHLGRVGEAVVVQKESVSIWNAAGRKGDESYVEPFFLPLLCFSNTQLVLWF